MRLIGLGILLVMLGGGCATLNGRSAILKWDGDSSALTASDIEEPTIGQEADEMKVGVVDLLAVAERTPIGQTLTKTLQAKMARRQAREVREYYRLTARLGQETPGSDSWKLMKMWESRLLVYLATERPATNQALQVANQMAVMVHDLVASIGQAEGMDAVLSARVSNSGRLTWHTHHPVDLTERVIDVLNQQTAVGSTDHVTWLTAPPANTNAVDGAGESGQPAEYTWLMNLITQRIVEHTYYPLLSRWTYQEGYVVITVTILESGELADATISQSSGLEDLDDEALTTVREIFPLPLSQPLGKPRVKALIPVQFKLDETNSGGLRTYGYWQY